MNEAGLQSSWPRICRRLRIQDMRRVGLGLQDIQRRLMAEGWERLSVNEIGEEARADINREQACRMILKYNPSFWKAPQPFHCKNRTAPTYPFCCFSHTIGLPDSKDSLCSIAGVGADPRYERTWI